MSQKLEIEIGDAPRRGRGEGREEPDGQQNSNTNQGKRPILYTEETDLLFQGSVKNSMALYDPLQRDHRTESVLLNKPLNLK